LGKNPLNVMDFPNYKKFLSMRKILAAAMRNHTKPKLNCLGSAKATPKRMKMIPSAEKGIELLKSFILSGYGSTTNKRCASLNRMQLKWIEF
jgi:hypothetical protein